MPISVQTSRPPTALSVVGPPRRSATPFSVEEPVTGTRVVLRGQLDVSAAADARLALAGALVAGSGELLVDLSALETIDATGLGVLVGAHRAAGRVGRVVVLLDVPARVERLLFVTRLHRVIRTSRTTSCA